MPKKQPRVPGTREVKPNREQRRHPEAKSEDAPLAREKQAPKEMDVPDPRLKSSGHKKTTADNWNQ